MTCVQYFDGIESSTPRIPVPLTNPTSSVAEPGRLHVLDVLRGIALIGMFLVHFSMFSSGGNALDRAYQKVVALLFEERFSGKTKRS